MLIHLIADYGLGDLSFAEVCQRLATLVPEGAVFATPVRPFVTAIEEAHDRLGIAVHDSLFTAPGERTQYVEVCRPSCEVLDDRGPAIDSPDANYPDRESLATLGQGIDLIEHPVHGGDAREGQRESQVLIDPVREPLEVGYRAAAPPTR